MRYHIGKCECFYHFLDNKPYLSYSRAVCHVAFPLHCSEKLLDGNAEIQELVRKALEICCCFTVYSYLA